jgi:type IV fimbrial biogenesis protein FimT
MKNENLKTMVYASAATRGFTLVELLVTLSVAGILVSIAIPNFQTLMASNRMSAQANDLITALTFARSEAVKRAANVTVCSSSDGATCTGGWAQGWIVRDAAGTPIRVQQALVGSSTLTGGTDVASTITFTSNGRTTIPTTATPATTTLTLCPPSPAAVQGRAIQLERTGRPNVSQVACP